jgi:glycosyltransferase involved in cell wall biosynthesis
VKVAFDSRPLSDPNGIGRYSRCLLNALRETAGAGDEVVNAQRPSTMARGGATDVFHSPWIDGAMLRCQCSTVVTVHNLAALKRRSEHLRTGLRMRLRHLAVQRATTVIVATETLAEDAVTHLRVERDRVVVIPEAADATMYQRPAHEVAAVRARFALPERYLVWVGDLQHPEPGRQLAKLAAAERNLALVLVGPTRPWAHELPNVILTGQVSDDQLAAIHSGAHALVLPSEDEAFGLAAVEALACGTPVVACETRALREVLAGRATFVAAGDLRALITAAEAAERPVRAAPSWSWEDAARATWGVYTRALTPADHAWGAGPSLRARRAGARRLDQIGPQ